MKKSRGPTGGLMVANAKRRPLVASGGKVAIPLALFVLAVAVRWSGLASQTHAQWGDEAQFMIFARNFIRGVYTTPFMIDPLDLPALYDFMLSVPLRLAGPMDLTVARQFDGILGALSAPLLYVTARELGYPQRTGIVAGVALATTFWDVSFSRLVLPNIMGVCATSLTVLLVVMAVRRRNLLLAALAGGALAWACYAHLTGMMVVPLIASWLVLLFTGYSRWWRRQPTAASVDQEPPAARSTVPRQSVFALGWRFLTGGRDHVVLDLNRTDTRPRPRHILQVGSTIVGAGLVCAWPLLQLYFGPGSALQGHAAERFLLSTTNRAAFAAAHPDIGSSLVGMLWYQMTVAGSLFTIRGQPGGVFNLDGQPLLDAVSGPLFILGVATALWSWRPAATLALLWLTVPLVFGTMLTIDAVWSFHRSCTAAPAMCLLIALGLETALSACQMVLGWLPRRTGSPLVSPTWWRAVQLSIVAVVTVIVGVQGVQHYWTFAQAPATKLAFYNSAHEWALFIAQSAPARVTAVGPIGWPNEYVDLYASNTSVCRGRWYSTWTRCPAARIVIFDNDPLDAQRYSTLTRINIQPGQSDDANVRFWYARGDNLPDPAHILAGVP